jgi:chromosome segregation ATPase
MDVGSDPVDERRVDALLEEASRVAAELDGAAQRQASWARRVGDELRALVQSGVEARAQRESTAAELAGLRRDYDRLWEQLRSIQADAETLAEERDALEQTHEELRRDLERVRTVASNTEMQLLQATDRFEKTERAVRSLEQERDALVARERGLADANAALEAEIDEVAAQRDALRELLDVTTEERDAMRVELQRSTADRDRSRAELDARTQGAMAEIRALQAALAAREADVARLDSERESADLAATQLSDELDALRRELVEARRARPASRDPADGEVAQPGAASPRKPTRGEGGIVEVVRHRSGVGNRL